MKTRRSVSKEDITAKAEDGGASNECARSAKVCNSPIIRTLRSRVITSDNEDEVQNNKTTSKRRLSRGRSNDDKSLQTGSDEDLQSKLDVDKTLKSPQSSKNRYSLQKLSDIKEINEENEPTDEAVESKLDFDKTLKSPRSNKRRYSLQKLSDLKEINEESEEPSGVKVESESTDSQDGSCQDELVNKVVDKLVKDEPEISDSNNVVQKINEKFNEVEKENLAIKEKREILNVEGDKLKKEPEGSSDEEKEDKPINEELENSSEEEREDEQLKKSENSDDERKWNKLIREKLESCSPEKCSKISGPYRLSHGVSPRRTSSGFIEVPNEDKSEISYPSEGNIRSAEAAEMKESEDEGSNMDSETTEDMSSDSTKENPEEATLKEEPSEEMTGDTSSNDSTLDKVAETEVLSKESEDEGNDSDDEMSVTVSNDSSKSQINKAMRITAQAIRRERVKEKKQQKKRESLKMLVKEPTVENLKEESSSSDDNIDESIQTKALLEEPCEKEESDSDGDAPEAISFDSGKDQMSRAMAMTAEAIKREKDRRKEQQRKRMEMIKIQKDEKERKRRERMKLLESNLPERLNEDVISRLPDVPEIPTIRPTESKKKKKRSAKEPSQDKEVKSEMSAAKKNKISKFDDYIPLDIGSGATKFGVVPLELLMQIPKSASERAAEFKQQMLFGSRIKREPSKSLLTYQQKVNATVKSRHTNL